MNEQVLVIAAHPDDEALGCGGTMARHVAEGDTVHVLFVADGETSRIQRGKVNRNLAAYRACKTIGAQPPTFLDLFDQKLDIYPLLEITQAMEQVVETVKPTIVYTHHAGDLNLDHRIVHQAAMTALRPLPGSTVRAIYAFEVLSSTEWGAGFEPNHFVDISGFTQIKREALEAYRDELRPFPHPRSVHGVQVLQNLRGCACGRKAAEAFMTLRSIV